MLVIWLVRSGLCLVMVLAQGWCLVVVRAVWFEPLDCGSSVGAGDSVGPFCPPGHRCCRRSWLVPVGENNILVNALRLVFVAWLTSCH